MSNTIKKDWLNPKELEAEFGFSITSQNRWRREKTIPFSKVGSRVMYSRTEINDWLHSNKVA